MFLIMSTKYPVVWPSLHTLELKSIYLDPRRICYGIFLWRQETGQAASASSLAHISAASSDAKTVTACFVELLFPNNDSHLAAILPLAQNHRMEGRLKLRTLVDDLVKEISRREQGVWAIKEGMFLFVSLMFNI
jgi:hypothetical protein